MKLHKMAVIKRPKPGRVLITSEMVKQARKKWMGYTTILPPAPDGIRLGISQDYEIFESVIML